MDKNVLKIIGLIVGLVVLVAAIIFVLLQGFKIGPINAISVFGITEKGEAVEQANLELDLAEAQYESNMQNLENVKTQFNAQKEAYELISDEKIAAVKEATKEEEYLIEYLWITLGNYATAHNLQLAVIEPGGTVGSAMNTTTPNSGDVTDVSTGTGISGNASGVSSTTNAAATGSPTSGTGEETEENVTTPVTSGLTSNASDLTVQVKGSYMDLADFVFEVENDKTLKFRLDNISMKSAGGTEVITSFKVKDFTVLKYLE